MTSAFFEEKRKLLIFADVINFSKKFFLKTKDIYKPYLLANFELIKINIPGVINILNFCWRQQKVFCLKFTKMAEIEFLAQGFLKRYFYED